MGTTVAIASLVVCVVALWWLNRRLSDTHDQNDDQLNATNPLEEALVHSVGAPELSEEFVDTFCKSTVLAVHTAESPSSPTTFSANFPPELVGNHHSGTVGADGQVEYGPFILCFSSQAVIEGMSQDPIFETLVTKCGPVGEFQAPALIDAALEAGVPLVLNPFYGVSVTLDEAELLQLKERTAGGASESSPMTRESFWQMIDAIIEGTSDLGEFENELDDRVRSLAADEIEDFARLYAQVQNEANTPEVLEAAFVIGCGEFNDGFMDFRRWIVFQGRSAFERIIQDPDSLGDYSPLADPIEQWYCEYDPCAVYEEVTGNELPPFEVDVYPNVESDYDKPEILAERYPKLWRRCRTDA